MFCFSLTPVDAKGGVGLPLFITLRFCPCVPGHGVCEGDILAENYTSSDPYHLQVCSCFPAWTGKTHIQIKKHEGL